jgi:alpha-D-xyloside xylohydrolase
LYKKGIDAWWMDASEPDMHSNINLDERKAVFQPSLGSSVRYYNTYPLMNAKGIYEGQRQIDPNNRVFILTRSYFAGQQRYSAAAWSGDIASRWHDMKDQISAGINFSLSGTPYWTMDAGGFLVERRFRKPNPADLEEWREMNARWYQYGAFLPMFRAHGQFPFREPFHIAPEDHPAYQSMIYYIQLRYKLLAYNYSLAAKTYFDNYSMIRAVAMDFSQDKATYELNDQYLWGPSLLVNPITEKGMAQRAVYLPVGVDWYDLYQGKKFEGGQTIQADAPYDRIPVFVKSGSILPIGKDLQYTGESRQDELTLYVYDGADASFDLYEDEGDNNNYEKGRHSTIAIRYDNKSGKLSIGQPQGTFDGMLRKRVFHIVLVSANNAVGVDSERLYKKTIKYKGKSMHINIK